MEHSPCTRVSIRKTSIMTPVLSCGAHVAQGLIQGGWGGGGGGWIG